MTGLKVVTRQNSKKRTGVTGNRCVIKFDWQNARNRQEEDRQAVKEHPVSVVLHSLWEQMCTLFTLWATCCHISMSRLYLCTRRPERLLLISWIISCALKSSFCKFQVSGYFLVRIPFDSKTHFWYSTAKKSCATSSIPVFASKEFEQFQMLKFKVVLSNSAKGFPKVF